MVGAIRSACVCPESGKGKTSRGPTGIRTQVAGIRTLSDNHLHYRARLLFGRGTWLYNQCHAWIWPAMQSIINHHPLSTHSGRPCGCFQPRSTCSSSFRTLLLDILWVERNGVRFEASSSLEGHTHDTGSFDPSRRNDRREIRSYLDTALAEKDQTLVLYPDLRSVNHRTNKK